MTLSCEQMTGWKLRQIMADKKVTNGELAKRLRDLTGRNTHQGTVSRWKQVDTMPKIDGIDLDAIATALGVQWSDLLSDKE